MADMEWIVVLARSILNYGLYGPGHRITTDASTQAWQALAARLEEAGSMELAVDGDVLIANGKALEKPHPSLHALRERMQRHGIELLRFDRACTAAAWNAFLAVLGTPPDPAVTAKPFRERLAAAGATGITSSHLVYRKVDAETPENSTPEAPIEQEVDQFLKIFQTSKTLRAEAEKAKASMETQPQPAPAIAGNTPDPGVESPTTRAMDAFLNQGAAHPVMDQTLAKAAGGRERDVGELVALLIAAIMMRKNREDLNGDQFSNLILHSLQKTVRGISDAGGTTEATARAIRTFGDQVRPWIQSSIGTVDAPAAQAAQTLMTDAAAETRAKAVLDTYRKRVEQLERWKAKAESAMTELGPERMDALGLTAACRDAGLTPPLALPSSPASQFPFPPTDGTPGTGASVTADAPARDLALNAMLSAWTFSLDTEGSTVSATEFKKDLENIRKEVEELIESTARKVETLAAQVKTLNPTSADAVPSMRNCIRVMAEAVQEIAQPLSVVLATLEILKSPRAAQMAAGQREETLVLATENARRLQKLVAQIGTIAGIPDSLKPDRAVLV